jgi:hypothetical protein
MLPVIVFENVHVPLIVVVPVLFAVHTGSTSVTASALGFTHERFPDASVCRMPAATVFVVVKLAGNV